MNWTESPHCRSHAHCAACRNSEPFRESILKQGWVESRHFDCPEGAKIGQTEGLPEPVIYAPKPEAPKPIAPAEWPLWAQSLAVFAKRGDAGLGDVVARIIGPIGGDAYKEWHLKIFQRPCGCTEKQGDLNAKYPLP
jgi:hypothetical protein